MAFTVTGSLSSKSWSCSLWIDTHLTVNSKNTKFLFQLMHQHPYMSASYCSLHLLWLHRQALLFRKWCHWLSEVSMTVCDICRLSEWSPVPRLLSIHLLSLNIILLGFAMCCMDTINPALKGLVCKEKIWGFHDTQLSAGFLCCYYGFDVLVSPKLILKCNPQHSGTKKWRVAMHPVLEHVCNMHKTVALIPSTIKHKSEPLGGWNSANWSDLSAFPFYFCPIGDDKCIILETKSDPWWDTGVNGVLILVRHQIQWHIDLGEIPNSVACWSW